MQNGAALPETPLLDAARKRHAFCRTAVVYGTSCQGIDRNPKETLMQWSHPAFEDMRFGFEITMYISNR